MSKIFFFILFAIGLNAVPHEDIIRLEKGPQASRVVVHNGIAYICGEICPYEHYTVEEQTRYILDKIDQRLAEIGTDKTRILQAWLIVSDIKYHVGADSIWQQWIGPDNGPARVSMVAGLGMPHFKVEIQMNAAMYDNKKRNGRKARSLFWDGLNWIWRAIFGDMELREFRRLLSCFACSKPRACAA